MMTMADHTHWTVDPEVDAVLRGQGMDPEPVRARSPRVVAAAEEAIEKGRALLRPRVVSREYAVVRHEPDGLALEGGEFRCGEGLAARLAGATRLIVVGVTVGDELLDHAVDVAESGDPLLALGMQGLGAAAAEDLAVQACRSISLPAGDRGEYGVLCWPGSAVWPNAEAQRQIFALLGSAEDAGEDAGSSGGGGGGGGEGAAALRLDEYAILRPVTSITFAIGVGASREQSGADAAASGPGGAETPCETCAKIPVCNFAGC
jgi:hypothetical protein